MNKKMKILIAYDGSNCAVAALDDLSQSGLPREAEAVVISVAELWLPPTPPSSLDLIESVYSVRCPAGDRRVRAQEAPAMEAAQALAAQASKRIQLTFPAWEVRAEGCTGSAARQILMKAEQWKPDLIVVGSHGRSALGRRALGSVSQKVATGAKCSVRVARGRVKVETAEARIVIGVDGSPDAETAVRTVAARAWPNNSEVRLVTSIGPFHHLTGPLIEEEEERAREIQHAAEIELRKAGLGVSAMVSGDDPKQALVREAEHWKADCIFVGTNGLSLLGRLLLGSVSTAVVARAHCSVEVVRTAELT